MGSKRVKAIIVEKFKMPTFHDRKKLMMAVKEYNAKLKDDAGIQNLKSLGTAMVCNFTNEVGGLPVRNFSSGQLVDVKKEPLKLGGDYLREQNLARGGIQEHACMPGCQIECSNVYANPEGKEVVSPLEYETIGILGANCGISEPDELARLNFIANDLGIDTIEAGGMFGVLMEAGIAEFGDVDYMERALDEDIRKGTEWGQLLAKGTARIGAHLKVERVPVIKQQALSAYDPRVIEVTGLSMMITAQGADHTSGNLPGMVSAGKGVDELVNASMDAQVLSATADSLGLCIFGRSVTNTNIDFIINAINDAHGIALEPPFFGQLGRKVLMLEDEFNRAAGFSVADDELPEFFYSELLPPSDKSARFHAEEVFESVKKWWQQHSEETVKTL